MKWMGIKLYCASPSPNKFRCWFKTSYFTLGREEKTRRKDGDVKYHNASVSLEMYILTHFSFLINLGQSESGPTHSQKKREQFVTVKLSVYKWAMLSETLGLIHCSINKYG